ncbi:aminoglycoside adenylyltransferase domain-containing protein [Leekyejoonella antrihumi]|uniref:DUF4111 domain-containing protein n=1 Tax=Leekyejoonella antrihumi TaxID=1660198 RepID=A0A563E8U9_9MICO|nr:aminoglycoside adenylyltransferase domain-containing protein [Leekyejoonella antrihumi]TWP38998.1 DUF4111 domain-containing protein [Leekyejoonella antrihumi]
MTRLSEESAGLGRALRQALGPGTVGVYLHGSAALGGWLAGTSDLDVLVVTESKACDGQRVLAACHSVHSPVELSVVTMDAAARPAAPWPFLLHATTGPDKLMVDDGGGDPDLLMHIAVTRAHGRSLLGPGPAEVFGVVSDCDISGYLRSELQWGVDHGCEAHAVLNACRALCWSRTGWLVSKIDGGTWAVARVPDHAGLIERALADQRIGRRCIGARVGAAELVAAVSAELAASAR